MNGSGCKNCPVNPCKTMNYRGSACAAQRAKFGLGDPKTNAERIRAMTDEELAKTFETDFAACPPNAGEDKWCDKDADCKQCWLDWLKQPAE